MAIKLHAASYDAMGNGNNKEAAKAPAKTKNCTFRLINVLFSDEISAKFISLGEKKSKNVLDSGLAGFDEYFWQYVSVQHPSTRSAFDDLAFYDKMLEGIDPSIKLSHSWSKLCEIYSYQRTMKWSERITRKVAIMKILLTSVIIKVK
jgi:hypothetical protein